MAEQPGVSSDALKAKITSELAATYVEIEDMSGGCGQAYTAIIVSTQFEKKTTLARHRLVNGKLKAEVAAIHAWTPKCYTPEQWEKLEAEKKKDIDEDERSITDDKKVATEDKKNATEDKKAVVEEKKDVTESKKNITPTKDSTSEVASRIQA